MEGAGAHSLIWGLVRAQHGVVARRQLLALGLSPKGVEHRLAAGRLHPLWPGVYAVGRPGVTVRGRWMAATLAAGDRALLSHASAAALYGIREHGATTPLHVSIPRRHLAPGDRREVQLVPRPEERARPHYERPRQRLQHPPLRLGLGRAVDVEGVGAVVLDVGAVERAVKDEVAREGREAELLARLRERLDHDPATEETVVRHELAEITERRLRELWVP